MADNSNSIIKEPSFRGKHSRSMRIWHWGTFIAISGSLTTVLFAKTLFSAKDNILLVQESLQKSNITVTADQAKLVAHGFSDLLWNWHTYIGYVLAALFGFRILFEFFQPKQQKLMPMLKNTLSYIKMPGADAKQGKYYLFVRCFYLLFYVALFMQVCTGLFMVYSDDVKSLKELRQTAKNIHNVMMWVIIAYIVIHIAGVILAELGKKYKGVVSDMINGGE